MEMNQMGQNYSDPAKVPMLDQMTECASNGQFKSFKEELEHKAQLSDPAEPDPKVEKECAKKIDQPDLYLLTNIRDILKKDKPKETSGSLEGSLREKERFTCPQRPMITCDSSKSRLLDEFTLATYYFYVITGEYGCNDGISDSLNPKLLTADFDPENDKPFIKCMNDDEFLEAYGKGEFELTNGTRTIFPNLD